MAGRLDLALFTYPYIYLLIGSALRGGNRSLEEAARSSGATPAQVLWRATLPLRREEISHRYDAKAPGQHRAGRLPVFINKP